MELKDSIKAVIFDIGATLVEGPPIAPAKVMAKLIPELDNKQISNIIMTCDFQNSTDIIKKIESEFFISINKEAVKEIEALWKTQLSACKELNNSQEVIKYLHERSIEIAFLSDIWHPYYEGVKKAIPYAVSTANIKILSFETGHKKPDLYNFQLALDKLNLKPEEILMIGDTYTHDMEPAIKLGINTCWLLRRPEEGRELESIIEILNGKKKSPTFTIKNIHEIKKLFK